jgi:Protein of unknown function (DUF2934)
MQLNEREVAMSDATQKVRKSKRRSRPVQSKQYGPEQAVHNIEEIVRQRAYYLWEREGKPEGREAEHWDRAQSEVRRELQQITNGPG